MFQPGFTLQTRKALSQHRCTGTKIDLMVLGASVFARVLPGRTAGYCAECTDKMCVVPITGAFPGLLNALSLTQEQAGIQKTFRPDILADGEAGCFFKNPAQVLAADKKTYWQAVQVKAAPPDFPGYTRVSGQCVQTTRYTQPPAVNWTR